MKTIWILFLVFSTGFVTAQTSKNVDLEFIGLKRNKEQFLRRLLKVKQGDPYDSTLIQKDIERLNRLSGIANAKDSVQDTMEGVKVIYIIDENFSIIPGLQISTANDDSFAYRLSTFDFNFSGNSQLIGGYYQKNVFDSYGFFWEHPFLFSDKVGVGLNFQDVTREEPIFFNSGEKDYRFNSRQFEGKVIFSLDFNNEAELGLLFVKENYLFEGNDPIPNTPIELNADKLFYRFLYRYINLDIDYQYFDGFQSEFVGQYIQKVSADDSGDFFLGDFLSLRNDLVYYKKVGKHGNWANRFRSAFTIGNEDSPFAPFTLDNQLNIRGVGNVVDRGTAALVLNTEYRNTLYEKGWFALQSNIFIDAGSWRNPGDEISKLFNGSTVRVNPGIGFRLIHKRIFNAVFRLDYGFGFGANSSSGIVFGIGQYF